MGMLQAQQIVALTTENNRLKQEVQEGKQLIEELGEMIVKLHLLPETEQPPQVEQPEESDDEEK